MHPHNVIICLYTTRRPSCTHAVQAKQFRMSCPHWPLCRLAIWGQRCGANSWRVGCRFMGIAEQMGRALQRTSISVNIKERLDFSCAMFGPDGSLVANAPHLPVHLGAMSEAVRFQVRQPNGFQISLACCVSGSCHSAIKAQVSFHKHSHQFCIWLAPGSQTALTKNRVGSKWHTWRSARNKALEEGLASTMQHSTPLYHASPNRAAPGL